MSAELNATVTMRYEINHGLLVLQVSPDEEMAPFEAGQYTVLGCPARLRATTQPTPRTIPPIPTRSSSAPTPSPRAACRGSSSSSTWRWCVRAP